MYMLINVLSIEDSTLLSPTHIVYTNKRKFKLLENTYNTVAYKCIIYTKITLSFIYTNFGQTARLNPILFCNERRPKSGCTNSQALP